MTRNNVDELTIRECVDSTPHTNLRRWNTHNTTRVTNEQTHKPSDAHETQSARQHTNLRRHAQHSVHVLASPGRRAPSPTLAIETDRMPFNDLQAPANGVSLGGGMSGFATQALWPTFVSTARVNDDALLQSFEAHAWELRAEMMAALAKNATLPQQFDNDLFFRFQDAKTLKLNEDRADSAPALLRELGRQACVQHLVQSNPDRATDHRYRRYLEQRSIFVWAAFIRPGDEGHGSHIHGGSVCSGVLWTSVPPGSPPLILRDPRHLPSRLQAHDDDNFPTSCSPGCVETPPDIFVPFVHDYEPAAFSTQSVVRPVAGDVVTFAPWLVHEVPKEWGAEAPTGAQRIAFSWNLLTLSEEEYQSNLEYNEPQPVPF